MYEYLLFFQFLHMSVQKGEKRVCDLILQSHDLWSIREQPALLVPT